MDDGDIKDQEIRKEVPPHPGLRVSREWWPETDDWGNLTDSRNRNKVAAKLIAALRRNTCTT